MLAGAHENRLAARAAVHSAWEKAGRKGMLTKGFNAAVWIFNMKNRCGWTDRADDNTEKTLHTVRIELPNAGAAEVITAGNNGEDDGTAS